ncbi:sialic acid-binding Ig-like lectin 16 [Dipodomys spectabilis]|uniref:sialic acid-binding Ig-like lectin 16 n=1 Tax=Dipodomys spectabilis TaxID=105255 RepID=UPI001C53CEB0|nr:sialic acid-binding Ig-like lectin 16 [Dipodomys spectabilis]
MQRLSTQLCLSLLLLSLGGSQVQERGYKVQVQSQVKVQEGLWVLVPCSFSYPSQEAGPDFSPAHGYWFTQGTNTATGEPVATTNPARPMQGWTQGRFQLGDPHKNDCTLFIRDARKEDEKNYFFRVEKGEKLKYNFQMDQFWLEVTAISLTPRPREHGTQLTCRVDFTAGNTVENTVRLSVACAPRDLVITIFRDNAQGARSSGRAGLALEKWKAQESQGNTMCMDIGKGQFLRLLCTSDGRPPLMVTWVLGNQVLLRSNATHPGTLGLDLPGVKVRDAGLYTCHAENRLDSQHPALDLSVQCEWTPGGQEREPPEVLTVTASQGNSTELEICRNGSSLRVLQGQSLRLVCVTHCHPPAMLSWAWGSQTLSPPWPREPGVLELPVVKAEHEGEFTCRAQIPLGTLHISLSLSVHCESCFSTALFMAAGLSISAKAVLSLCLIVVVIMKKLRKSTSDRDIQQASFPVQHCS